MGSEARSWADQWGAGGIGAIEYDEIDTRSQKDTNNNNKNSGAKVGFTKAKAVAVIGLEKIKSVMNWTIQIQMNLVIMNGPNLKGLGKNILIRTTSLTGYYALKWAKYTCAIKTLVDTHICVRILNNRSTSFKWVVKAVVKKMQTSEIVRIRDIIQDIRQKFYVGISVARSWKAKLIAKKIIEGDVDKQFANLWRYVAKLTRINHRNTLKIIVERPFPSIQPRFDSFYFCFDCCKKGFINGCRPFVGVGGCHLKTKYGGQLLIVVGRDPNDQYFPLVFGVVETETKES
ncbi:uncharacterized protein LOC127113088 [Lathyrus oleraceus]|uniref:uncharacterized protein LOC127113088 n=1 Tax=Pisum sativum TaxID=3888 RepID=UPI0021CEAF35|nr:uncharacterized protein LOC127113088 [Pisum sativum]